MNVALTAHWEGSIRQLIDSGRYNNASEVVRTALRKIQETEGAIFPAGSLKDLYSKEENAAECKLAKHVRMPKPDDVSS
jgi:putative addiction module CopG family antidote